MEKKKVMAWVSVDGTLSLPKELLPKDFRKKKMEFLVTIGRMTDSTKELVLTPLEMKPRNGGVSSLAPRRKAYFSNKASRSPQVSVLSFLRTMQVSVDVAQECPIKKQGDGSLVVILSPAMVSAA